MKQIKNKQTFPRFMVFGRILCAYMTLMLLFAALAAFFPFTGCAALEENAAAEEKSPGEENLTIINWNVQTFFDAETSGTEYDEYIKSKEWGEALYKERLERLCKSIKLLDADVLVLEELENEGTLHDICNFLAGEWNAKKVYGYACFAKDEGSAIGCGVLSRCRLENLTVHSLDSVDEKIPRMRPLMQVSVVKGKSELILFVNHWKSMSAGKAASEKWRTMQESVLSRRISHCLTAGKAVIACGDFNRDILDFENDTERDIILLRDEGTGEAVHVVSPWFDSEQELIPPGSYYFNGEWSRIDNFFVAGAISILDFAPQTEGPWCEEDTKIPKKYKLWTKSGYSDHLPIRCTVQF